MKTRRRSNLVRHRPQGPRPTSWRYYIGGRGSVARPGQTWPLYSSTPFDYRYSQASFVGLESWIVRGTKKTRLKDWNPFTHYKYEIVEPARSNQLVELGYGDSPYPSGMDMSYRSVTFDSADLDYALRGGYKASSGYMITPSSWRPVQSLYNGVNWPTWPAIATRDSKTGIITPTFEVDLEDLERRAMQRLLPGIKAELSTINSVIELKDLVTLKSTVKHVASLLSSAGRIRSVASLLKEAKGSVQSLADVWLQANFGIKPLIADLVAIHKVWTETHANVNRLLSGAGKLTKRHYRFSWKSKDNAATFVSEGTPFEFPNSGYRWPLTNVRTTQHVSDDVYTYHAELEMDYSFSAFQEEHALLLAYQDALGININPGVVWNAIPYSFVVDWVANIGNFLDNFSVQYMTPTINIRRFCYSLKRERTVSRSISTVVTPAGQLASWAFPQKVIQNIPVRGYRETFYQRVVTTAPSGRSLQTSGVSLKELSLGAALLVPQGKGKVTRKRSR